MRTGEYSTFTSPTGVVDTFTEKTSADLITSFDWNKLGDSIYRLESAILELKTKEQEARVNTETRFWTGSFSPTWTIDSTNMLSCTGKIVIPVSGCLELGTYWPVQNSSLVKIQMLYDTPDNLRYFRESNITSAVWCPSNKFLDTSLKTYVVPPDYYTRNGVNISFAENFDPSNPDEFYRTIIVGLYFNGFPAPTNINTWGLKAHVFIMLPG